MRIQGKVTFNQEFIRSNQVTLEGAEALVDVMLSNRMALVTNILYVTDGDQALQLQQSSGGAKYVTWSQLNSVIDPTVITRKVADVEEAKKGNMLVSDLVSDSENIRGFTCKTQWDVSAWPSPQKVVYGLALVLNGNVVIEGNYVQTGSERVLAYLDLIGTPLQISPSRNNVFTWDVSISVEKEQSAA